MNAEGHASNHNENSNLIMLNNEQPVVAEDNSYDKYNNSQLVSNNYSHNIIQEYPFRDNDESDTDSSDEDEIGGFSTVKVFPTIQAGQNQDILPQQEKESNLSNSLLIGIRYEGKNVLINNNTNNNINKRTRMESAF